ncbi:MAG: redoxin domain-containing protein [Verrucomicrobiales bacterium]|nr:redoxin domain-containing protein [Verrucomicrobiales bacterium]
MKLGRFFLFLYTVSLLHSPLTIAEEEGMEAPPPLFSPTTKDRFSGKVITDKTSAYSMMEERLFNAPKTGEKSPDFELRSAEEEKRVKLSDLYAEKPVVLILSSWSCDIFRESLWGLNDLYDSYNDRAEFVMIYMREAHPLDGFAAHLGRTRDPKTIEERILTAKKCRKQLRLPFRILVDDIDDPVMTRWAGWPVRIYVVESDGTVSYAGPQGPWGYRPYEGFVHGNGELHGWDLEYSNESLEKFLQTRFPGGGDHQVQK